MKILTLFGGIGAPEQALQRLGIELDMVDYVELDKFAVKSYNAINGANYTPQDIQNWNHNGDKVDMIVHGSPCQSFSIAGKQEGGNEGTGTQSSLLYKSIEIIIDSTPKYVIWENVKNVLSKKHRHNFDNYLETLEDLGYTNYWQVLNAKDYSVPQNRERVFCVSILGEHTPYEFPASVELETRLKDVLEDEVDEKFYLKENISREFKHQDVSFCLDANYSKGASINQFETKHRRQLVQVPSIEMLGLLNIKGNEQIRRVYGESGISPCLNTMQGGNRQPKVLQDPRVRRLTPRECWRLMNFSDEVFDKAQEVNSNSQLYKQAGNSIVVSVLEAIFRKLLLKEET